MKRTLPALLLLALGACSGMDVAECQVADWRAIGYEDGSQGKSPARFGELRKACAKHGIAADFNGYMAGRAEGLAYFCHPHNGYRLGTNGYRYTGVCPPEMEGMFLAAHADGYGLYERNATLQGIRKRLHRSRDRAGKLEYLLAEKTAELVAADTLVTERAALAIELKQLTEEKVQLEGEIDQLEYDYTVADQEYRRYREYIATRTQN